MNDTPNVTQTNTLKRAGLRDQATCRKMLSSALELSDIPVFPLFKKIEISDRNVFRITAELYGPFSDFDFTTLWSWDIDGNRGLSQLNGNIVIRFTDYLTGEQCLSFLGNNKVNLTIQMLMLYASTQNISSDLRYVPSVSILKKSITHSIVDVLEDPDNFDYVYSLEELVACVGQKFATARNMMHRFANRNDNIEITMLDLNKLSDQKKIKSLNRLWRENKGVYIRREEMALGRLLREADKFELLNVGILVGGELVAFSINEVLGGGYAISHFAKADIKYAGVYSYLLHETAILLLGRGCKHLNYEQDLGIPNLRQAKTSYNPEYFLEKYSVVSKQH